MINCIIILHYFVDITSSLRFVSRSCFLSIMTTKIVLELLLVFVVVRMSILIRILLFVIFCVLVSIQIQLLSRI